MVEKKNNEGKNKNKSKNNNNEENINNNNFESFEASEGDDQIDTFRPDNISNNGNTNNSHICESQQKRYSSQLKLSWKNVNNNAKEKKVEVSQVYLFNKFDYL